MNYYDLHYQHWVNTKKGVHPAHDFLEKPAMVEEINKLVEAKGAKFNKVLLLGCGSGEELELLLPFIGNNAEVVGLDSSTELVKMANFNYGLESNFKTENNVQVSFNVIDINQMDKFVKSYNGAKFDLVYSSLTMHYIDNWISVLKPLLQIIEPNSNLVFSTHHPIKWGSQTTRSSDENLFLMGYKKIKNNSKDYQVYGNYLEKRKVGDVLFGKIKFDHYHKSISEMFNQISDAGFVTNSIIEPTPTTNCKAKFPDFYHVHSKIPLFIIFSLRN